MIVVVLVAVAGGILLLDRPRRLAVARAGSGPAVASPLGRLRRLGSGTRRPSGTGDDAATVEAIARSLRSGASVHRALADASGRRGELADRLRDVVAAAAAGRPIGGELRRVASASPDELGPALRLLAVALDEGGSSADAVARCAAVVRADQALRADAKVQSTQARSSAAVITALPLLFVLLSMLIVPAVPDFLVGEPLGWLVLAVGIGLDGVGWWWMRWLTRRTLP